VEQGKRARDEELAGQPPLQRIRTALELGRQKMTRNDWDDMFRRREKRLRADVYRMRHGGKEKGWGPADLDMPTTRGQTHTTQNSRSPAIPPPSGGGPPGEDGAGAAGGGGGGGAVDSGAGGGAGKGDTAAPELVVEYRYY
jgi:hypothetical protein